MSTEVLEQEAQSEQPTTEEETLQQSELTTVATAIVGAKGVHAQLLEPLVGFELQKPTEQDQAYFERLVRTLYAKVPEEVWEQMLTPAAQEWVAKAATAMNAKLTNGGVPIEAPEGFVSARVVPMEEVLPPAPTIQNRKTPAVSRLTIAYGIQHPKAKVEDVLKHLKEQHNIDAKYNTVEVSLAQLRLVTGVAASVGYTLTKHEGQLSALIQRMS